MPREPSAAIREEKLPMQGPLDTAPVETTFAVYETGRALTYLPDPLAVEVAVRVFDHPEHRGHRDHPDPALSGRAMARRAAVRDRGLRRRRAKRRTSTQSTHRLRVPLPKARSRKAAPVDDAERRRRSTLLGVFALARRRRPDRAARPRAQRPALDAHAVDDGRGRACGAASADRARVHRASISITRDWARRRRGRVQATCSIDSTDRSICTASGTSRSTIRSDERQRRSRSIVSAATSPSR